MKTGHFAVLGAGKQGKAAAYDLARENPHGKVIIADKDERVARESADYINHLLGKSIVVPIALDASDSEAVKKALAGVAGFVSAMHFTFNLELTKIAIALGAHMVDMGGNTSVVLEQQKLNVRAEEAGVTIIPDCGMAPGFDVNLAMHAILQVSRSRSIKIYCGGIPREPKNPPLNYSFPFSVKGLVNECSGFADVIRGGKLTKQECLVGREYVHIPGVGTIEAAYTSGGLSTAPWSFKERYPDLETLEYKTLRYLGHWQLLEQFAHEGRLEEALAWWAKNTPPDPDDIGIIRIIGCGFDRSDKLVEWIVDVQDRYDPATGFTAMQRLTGFHASVALLTIAKGVCPGVLSVDSLLPAFMMNELERRGVSIKESHKEI